MMDNKQLSVPYAWLLSVLSAAREKIVKTVLGK